MSVQLTMSQNLLVELIREDSHAREMVRRDPARAFAALVNDRNMIKARKNIFFPSAQALALDEILGCIADPKEAKELLNSYLTPEAVAEMIAMMGERPSVVSQVADIQTVLAALEMNLSANQAASLIEPYLLLKAWAINLKERSNWEEE